jgi:malate synthase
MGAMKEQYTKIHNLSVSNKLLNFINEELLKDTNISSEKFWEGFDKVVHELAQKNKELLKIREDLQKKIDNWHITNKGNEINLEEYKKFLKEIGYLKEVGPDFKIQTNNVDEEITSIAGPQLVVPIMNERYALNAANARWMSLYDSLYGTDIIEQSEDSTSQRYDPLRGEMVIKYGRDFLKKHFPLENLDMSPYIKGYEKDKYKYNLYAVSNHSGGMGGGHYWSYIKNIDNNWYKFNDNVVSTITKENVVSETAYCLFYTINN